MIAPRPANEIARLAALRQLQILDTPPEAVYDDIVRLASDICQTPIALVSLVDDTRQWFKSVVGISPGETHRDDSFCAHAILEPEQIMIVQDACQDVRFADNQFVLGDPWVRFYAGAPLVTREGYTLGALCVIDRVPRTLTASQLDGLRALRRCVITEFELRRNAEQWKAIGEELARTDRMKEEFLANMSHELRTPLNAVLGFSELLGAQSYGPLNGKQAHLVKMIEEGGRHLLELVNDILDLAKVNAGKLNLVAESTPVEGICEASLALVRTAAQAKQIEVSLQVDPHATTIFVDPLRLKQILVNLLSNAVKFTENGGRIGLNVEIVPESPHLTFTVWDTGIGIDVALLESVFQPFVQLESGLARKSQGTGLGLSLVDRLTKLLGGKLEVKSEVGVGSRFSITLPREERL